MHVCVCVCVDVCVTLCGVVNRFQTEEEERAEQERSNTGANQGVQDNLSALFQASILEQKSYSDFTSSLAVKKGNGLLGMGI